MYRASACTAHEMQAAAKGTCQICALGSQLFKPKAMPQDLAPDDLHQEGLDLEADGEPIFQDRLMAALDQATSTAAERYGEGAPRRSF
jgi:hypothetical protein